MWTKMNLTLLNRTRQPRTGGYTYHIWMSSSQEFEGWGGPRMIAVFLLFPWQQVYHVLARQNRVISVIDY